MSGHKKVINWLLCTKQSGLNPGETGLDLLRPKCGVNLICGNDSGPAQDPEVKSQHGSFSACLMLKQVVFASFSVDLLYVGQFSGSLGLH